MTTYAPPASAAEAAAMQAALATFQAGQFNALQTIVSGSNFTGLVAQLKEAEAALPDSSSRTMLKTILRSMEVLASAVAQDVKKYAPAAAAVPSPAPTPKPASAPATPAAPLVDMSSGISRPSSGASSMPAAPAPSTNSTSAA